MPVCQDVHPFCREVTWDQLAWDLIGLPTVVTIVLISLMVPLNKFWLRNQKRGFAQSVRRLVGNEELTHLHHPTFLKIAFTMEILFSMWFAALWVIRTYTPEVWDVANLEEQTKREAILLVDRIFCVFFMIAYTMNAARDNFNPMFALHPSSLITVVTVVPTFSRKATSSNWFSFGYLRASNAVIAVNKIWKMGALKDVGDVTQMYIQLSLRTFSLVMILVGSVFVLEVLGDPGFLQDSFIETEMGGLSVVQLTYWIMTTISTVGYGDFAPKTVLSRIFIIIAIVFWCYVLFRRD